jgi:hypothetical protein
MQSQGKIADLFLTLFAVLLICFPLTMSGCANSRQSPTSLTAQEATQIAIKDAFAKWKGTFPRATGSKRLQNGNWLIFVELLPGVPGAHNAAEVSSELGKVIHWYGGA